MNRLLVGVLVGESLLVSARPAAADACGDLLIVLDRSISMAYCSIGGRTKEAIAKAALKSVLAANAAVPTGIEVFPGTLASCPADPGAEACKVGVMARDISPDGAMKVSMFLDGMPQSCGGTPTGSSLEVARDYARWSPGKTHFVLLLTDGQPTCEDGIDGDVIDTMADKCVPGMPGAACNGQGACECRNPTRAFDAIKAMADKGIHTFVVGFEGKGSGSGCGDGGMPFNPDTLNKMADLGIEAQGSPAATRYYSTTDEASLNTALKKILGKVAGATGGGCVAGGGGSGGGTGGKGGSGGSAGSGGSGGNGGSGGGSGAGGTRQPPGCACARRSIIGRAPGGRTEYGLLQGRGEV